MTGSVLAAAVAEDRARGLLPFCCVATLGTTSSCAFDHIQSLGPVCEEEVRTWKIFKPSQNYINVNQNISKRFKNFLEKIKIFVSQEKYLLQ